MRLKIDYTRCVKSGQCYYMHPEIVTRGPRDLPRLLNDELKGDQVEDAETLLDICPASAFTLED